MPEGNTTKTLGLLALAGVVPYQEAVGEEYMNPNQLEHFRRILRTGECDHVLAGEVIEQVAGTAANELQGTIGQDPGFDDAPHHQLGQVSRAGRRLDDGRHAGKKAWRQFLEHAPAWKIVCIDMQGQTVFRGQNVPAHETSAG